jgi:hypothetical protein
MADLLTTANLDEHWNDRSSWAGAVPPAQFYSERNGAASDDPLHRLMRAILADAIRCFQMGLDARQPGKRRLYAETRSWFFADECDGVFSFR